MTVTAPLDETDGIHVIGARENNLKNVSLVIPRNRITVFVGLSGSGKSSLVFDTVAVEAQRQLNATFPWSIRAELPKFERPHVEAIRNLSTPVVVDQRQFGGNSRSTVGTITDIYSMMRVLFANHGTEASGQPWLYSFNDPQGMCPECQGLGRTRRPDPDLMLDRTKSLDDGALLLPGFQPGAPNWQMYGRYDGLDPAKVLLDYTPEQMRTLLYGGPGTVVITFSNGKTHEMKYEGLVGNIIRRYLTQDGATAAKNREAMAPYVREGVCPDCDGSRLNAAALANRIGGHNIAEWCRMEVRDLVTLLAKPIDGGWPALADVIRESLEQVAAIGLGYLTLGRPTSTLSGGEGQRLKLVKHLGSDLTGLTYIFDEPSVGLHPRDVGRLNDLLRALRDKGNTVIVVEHDPDVMAIADHVVEVGPGAGSGGGRIVFEGPFSQLLTSTTVTGESLRRRYPLKTEFRRPSGVMSLTGVSLHNLKNVSVDVPTGVLTVVTGVAGAGKSSLIAKALRERHPECVLVDQTALPRSSRSTPASYLGMMDPVRKLFAKASGADASSFSFNSKGACDECGGRGALITEIPFMDPVTTHCASCDGRRFKESVLRHKLRGRSIAEVLTMSGTEAAEFFTEPMVRVRCQALVDAGLGYLQLGQSLSTLSGGERQRLKLADRLTGDGTVYILEEPTTGLHLADTGMLLSLLTRMVDRGNTLVVIEHNPAVILHADWVIDLGPDGGKNGGEVVFSGLPVDLIEDRLSITADHLRRHLAG